ncbi:MAG: hypothetical protein AAF351_08610 [Pseudomonadota bacterium]
MSGIMKSMAAIAVIFVAGLATLLVFGIIPTEIFSEALTKFLLAGVIIVLASVALGFIMRSGK